MNALPTEGRSGQPALSTLFVVLGLVWLTMFVIELTGYPDLMDNERRVGGYVMDAVQNGHWLVQRDVSGDVASKPPMLTWLIALPTLALGQLTRFAIYLPSALATLGVTWLILHVGRAKFGWKAGLLGALAYLLSYVADNQLMTARYDGLFALPVMLGALAAHRAWNQGRGWTWFWLASALATLVKGPLGLLLAATGLLAAVWEWHSGHPQRVRGNHLPGVLLYLLICGGWFGLAYLEMGQPLIDKMIGRELVGHSLGAEESGAGGAFYQPLLNVVFFYLPWSILALIAWWRVWKTPALDGETRRFERFLFCWFFVGLLMFSLSGHQHGRLIYPLIPAAALLVGRELARWLASFSWPKTRRLVAAATICTLAFLAIYHHVILRSSGHARDAMAMQALADNVSRSLGTQFPLSHVDDPFVVQFYLNTFRPMITPQQAVALLRGEADTFLVVEDMDKIQANLGTNAPPLFEFFPTRLHNGHVVRVVGNHPKLEWTDHMAAIFGPLLLRMDGVKLLRERGNTLVFERQSKPGTRVIITNASAEGQQVRVRFAGDAPGIVQERWLASGDTWVI